MSEYWYLSGDGSPKGPFTIKKMREWHQFYPLQMNLDVMVRLGNEGSFKPLREWPQLVAPEGSPEAEDAPAAAVQTALVPRKPLQWYYAVDGAEYGPYSVEQLRLWESSGYFADFAEVPVRSNDDQDVRTSLAELLEGNFGSTASANAPAAAPAAATDPVSPATPNQVVRNFDAAMASLSSGSGGSTWRGDGAVAAAASSTVLIQAPAVAQLRDLSLRVRESQSELDTRSADLQSGLFATIEALQESHARAESMLNDKIRECEQLRAENEKLQMYLKLHANTEVAGTPGRW